MKLALSIINELELNDYLTHILKNNTANTAPYHNFYHMECMVENVIKLGIAEGLPMKSHIKPLVIAAMFHDFNHSEGALPDSDNVNIAVNNFLSVSHEIPSVNARIESIIRATQYPYVEFDEPLSIEQKIIRDADLMQCVEDNRHQQIMFGLMTQELKMDLVSALNAKLKFMSQIQFYTQHARVTVEPKLFNIKEEYEFLLKLLTKN